MPSSAAPPVAVLRGGEWLLTTPAADAVFTPERLSDEHKLIAATASAFIANEVLPVLARLEEKDWALSRQLLRRCGDLGLLGVDAAEAYGGMDLDKVTSMIVSERMSNAASFAATFGAQANLTVLPLSLFGTDDQKQRYLPRLVSGDIVGAYCLSESGSGSDALGAKTTARLQSDGSYLLNGEKMWITNGGLADVFIVFAQVVGGDQPQFSAFIVDRASGVTSGKEEHKMGLHGSSTTPIVLQDARVPASNLLGEIGKGHKVAFNVLNFGRFKLGAMCAGGAKGAIGESARYAAERRQFGQPIASFGAIKHKLGAMTVRTYAVESLAYRTAGMIDARMASGGPVGSTAALAALEEYAIEASIAKVAGSEVLDFVLDENIQIHGGNGYVSDYPAERHYRDSRVNRIFEGTNEINRLLIGGMLARRAAKNELPLIAAAKALQEEVLAPPALAAAGGGVLDDERRTLNGLKKATLLVFGLGLQRYGVKAADEQEFLVAVADIAMAVYAADSAVLRAQAAHATGVARASFHVDAAQVAVSDAAFAVEAAAREALASIAAGDDLRLALAALRRFVKPTPINTVERRRRLADETAARGGYIF